MYLRQLVLLLSTVTSLQVCDSASVCNIPSRLLCHLKEIASECGVYEQCQKEFTVHQDASPVSIALYYEALCPGCRDFITQMLHPTYEKLASIMDITLVPYGNTEEAKVRDRWDFTCQHGPDECIGNIIETCTIAIVKSTEKYLPFINCIESSHLSPQKAAKQCAPQFSIPWDEVLNCSSSDYGNQLEHQMAVLTDRLVPQHEYVPWITVNGVFTQKIYDEATTNLTKLVCDTYQGVKPPACNTV